jgi:hypothetical protein
LCRLDKKDIGALRRSDDITGSDIVGKLVEGSATFQTETGFSKAKYIRKKMQKHVFTVRVLQPTAFNMAQVFYSMHMPRIHRMRFDSLVRLLTSSNVTANARVLCADGCGGLVAGAILEKLAPTPSAAAASGDATAVRGGMVIAYTDARAAIDAGASPHCVIALLSRFIVMLNSIRSLRRKHAPCSQCRSQVDEPRALSLAGVIISRIHKPQTLEHVAFSFSHEVEFHTPDIVASRLFMSAVLLERMFELILYVGLAMAVHVQVQA